MPKSMLIAVTAGLASLLAALPALKGLPGGLLLSYVAGLPIYLAGFAYGVTAGTVASLSGFAAAALLGGFLVSGVYALVHLLPAWTIVRQAMLQRATPDGGTEWMPAGPIVGSVTGLAAVLLLVAGGVLLFEGTGLSKVIESRLTEVIAGMAPDVAESQRQEMVAFYGPLLPATAGSSWIVMALVNAAIAQNILTRAGKNLRPTPRYANMVLPDWISWAIVGSAVVYLVTSGEVEFLALHVTLILAVPFFLLGLAVVHQWARRLKHPGLALVLFYVFLLLVGFVGILFATGIGVVEQWAGIRKRLPSPARGGNPPDDE